MFMIQTTTTGMCTTGAITFGLLRVAGLKGKKIKMTPKEDPVVFIPELEPKPKVRITSEDLSNATANAHKLIAKYVKDRKRSKFFRDRIALAIEEAISNVRQAEYLTKESAEQYACVHISDELHKLLVSHFSSEFTRQTNQNVICVWTHVDDIKPTSLVISTDGTHVTFAETTDDVHEPIRDDYDQLIECIIF
jgi:hypothetical protein